MNKETKEMIIAAKLTEKHVLEFISIWLLLAKRLPRTTVGKDRDWALNRADWWAGIYLDIAHKRKT